MKSEPLISHVLHNHPTKSCHGFDDPSFERDSELDHIEVEVNLHEKNGNGTVLSESHSGWQIDQSHQFIILSIAQLILSFRHIQAYFNDPFDFIYFRFYSISSHSHSSSDISLPNLSQ
jgi:hypothetical protein